MKLYDVTRAPNPRRFRIFIAEKGLAEKGLAVEQPPSPLRHHTRRQSEAERKRLRELIRRRDQSAAELALDPTLIASRSTLIELAQDWENHQGNLMQWQRELLQA